MNIRIQYLEAMKALVGKCMARRAVLNECCPELNPDGPKQDSLRKISAINADMDGICQRLREIEQEAGGKLGVPALFQDDADNVTRIVLAFLTSKSLSRATAHELSSVGSICEISANAPADCLTVRDLFREDSPLRPYIHFFYANTVDSFSDICWTEDGFTKFLDLPPNPEISRMSLLARGRR